MLLNNDHTSSLPLVIEIILGSVDEALDNNIPTIEMERPKVHIFTPRPTDQKQQIDIVVTDGVESVEIGLPEFSLRLINHMGKLIMDMKVISFVDFNAPFVEEALRCVYRITSFRVTDDRMLVLGISWDRYVATFMEDIEWLGR